MQPPHLLLDPPLITVITYFNISSHALLRVLQVCKVQATDIFDCQLRKVLPILNLRIDGIIFPSLLNKICVVLYMRIQRNNDIGPTPCFRKATTLLFFNNSVKNKQILIIFGIQNPEKWKSN